jgi:uncharacterized protein YjbJ (UPF0337 family)
MTKVSPYAMTPSLLSGNLEAVVKRESRLAVAVDKDRESGKVQRKIGNVQRRTGNVPRKEGDVQRITGNAQRKTGNVQRKTGNIRHHVDHNPFEGAYLTLGDRASVLVGYD